MRIDAPSSPAVVRRAAAALAVLALLAAGCGGGEEDSRREGRDVQAILDRAFGTPIEGADLRVDAQLELDGVEGIDAPIRFEASGPFVSRERTLPLLDLDVRFGVQDAGQAVEVGFLSTGDRAFLEFAGEFYEQPAEDVRRANSELVRRQADGGSLDALGLHPLRWVVDPRDEGGDEVGGVETDHVSAQIDVRALLRDLNRFVERSGGALGGEEVAPLPEAEIERLSDLFEATRFDVYAGREDGVIRRVSANVELVVPESERERFRGLERASLRISVELSDVGGEQRVEAPADARPISDLATQLEGVGALGGAGGLALPGDEAPEAGGVPGEDDEQSTPEALREYDECLDKAAPDDTEALTRCSTLLPPR